MLQNRICRKCGIAFASHRCESCHRASSAAYRANNHDKVIAAGRAHCAAKGDDYQLDHIMPIALGGANEDWNIQLLRKTCNRQKSAKHPVVFMQERGMLL